MPRRPAPVGASLEDTARPRTRQRIYKSPPPIPVPDIDEDAVERKRVLNVLAQRRYRQRKRQSRLAGSDDDAHGSPSQDPSLDATQPPELQHENFQEGADASIPVGDFSLDLLDPQWMADQFNESAMALALECEPQPPCLLFGDSLSFLCGSVSGDSVSPTMLTMASTTASGSAQSSSGLSHASSSSSPNSNGDNNSFPDSYLLPLNELTLLRAALRIAERLNSRSIWDLTSNSSFNLGTSPPAELLPAAWQPTVSQIIVPHHPIIDLLPWPTSRDKILDVLDLPEEARPLNARGPLALMNFVHDLEDSAEGIRIWGSDPYDAGSWELGQVAFERWWFIFDRSVVERSNYWRRLRGAPSLRIAGGALTPSPRVTEE